MKCKTFNNRWAGFPKGLATGPTLPTQPARDSSPSSPPARLPFSFYDRWGNSVSLPYIIPLTPFPPPSQRVLARPRPCARLMGRPPALLARTPSRYTRVHARKSPKGEKDPLAFQSHADRGLAGNRRATTSPLRPRVQSPCAKTSLPLRRLDRVPTPRRRASTGHPPTRIGVFPLLGSPPWKEERRGSGEREGGAGKTKPHP
jgi:hypothetical protein